MKIIKKYKLFLESISYNNRFKFEELVIDPILILIRDNQEYLTEPRNLPQLAKLGYLYNTLWYNGRTCWGYDGLLLDKTLVKDDNEENVDNIYNYTSCEENPKYKIEMCNPMNDRIEELIYDAWGMHNESDPLSFDEFIKPIKDGRELSDLDKKLLKINKTFDEWVEILTDKKYKYSSMFPDRRSVENYLLCTIGTGYSWNKDGFIIQEASGADQDVASYGDWENTKFRDDINKEVLRILSIPEVKLTVDTSKEYIEDSKKKRKVNTPIEADRELINIMKDKFKDDVEFTAYLNDETQDYGEVLDAIIKKLTKKIGNFTDDAPVVEEKKKYQKYYSISVSSNIYPLGDDEARKRIGIAKFDKSYIDATENICKEKEYRII